MKFSFGTYRFVIQPSSSLTLPRYKGGTIRGGLGWAFKDLVCIRKDRNCEPCLIKSHCSYYQISETPVPDGAEMMRKYTFAPHPFVLTPPLTEREVFSPSEEISFDLTLIGRVTDYLPYFIHTYEALGRSGIGKNRSRFVLLRVEAPQQQEDSAGTPVYDAKAKSLRSTEALTFDSLSGKAHHTDGNRSSDLWIRFLTPAHVVTGGRIDHELQFVSLMKSLLRRIQLLQHFYCNGSDENTAREGDLTLDAIHSLLSLADNVEIIESRLKWSGHRRNSGHNGNLMMLSGFLGEIGYRFPSREALRTTLPYLLLGEHTHVGKHTSFGLGKFVVEVTKENTRR